MGEQKCALCAAVFSQPQQLLQLVGCAAPARGVGRERSCLEDGKGSRFFGPLSRPAEAFLGGRLASFAPTFWMGSAFCFWGRGLPRMQRGALFSKPLQTVEQVPG